MMVQLGPKVDLIRGLPRSEENHATNGMQYDPVRNIPNCRPRW